MNKRWLSRHVRGSSGNGWWLVLKLLIWLGMGFAVTFAVAATVSATWSRTSGSPRTRFIWISPTNGTWSVERLECVGSVFVDSWYSPHPEPSLKEDLVDWGDPATVIPRWTSLPPSIAAHDVEQRRWIQASGWPALAFVVEYIVNDPPHPTVDGVVGGIHIGSDLGAIPTSPLWFGLAADTVFYGIILFAILRGPILIRSVYRVRHGQCVACGYPHRSPGVCSECGHATSGDQDARGGIEKDQEDTHFHCASSGAGDLEDTHSRA